MPKEETFKESFQRLRKISEILDKQDIIDVDELITLQKEAKELYHFCSEKLEGVSETLSPEKK